MNCGLLTAESLALESVFLPSSDSLPLAFDLKEVL